MSRPSRAFALLGVALAWALLAAGCISPETVLCGDVVCPAGSQCVEELGGCFQQASLDACDDEADGSRCDTAEIRDGVCRGGACFLRGCGDGIRVQPEDCDGDDTGGATCEDIGYYRGGSPTCRSDCSFDASSCEGTCGDGIINGPELCDGNESQVTDCTDLGYYQSGPVGCTPVCTVDTSQCSERCGDGVVNGPEQCDGDTIPVGASCIALGFDGGFLECTGTCSLSLQSCLQIGMSALPIIGAFPYALTGRNETVYIGGNQLFSRFDSTAITPLPVLPDTILGLHATSSQVYAATTSGLRVWDGSSWTPIAPSFEGTSLEAIHGTSDTDLWAVGQGGLILHYDGTDWQSVNDSGNSGDLEGVWAVAENDVWAVGSGGVVLRHQGESWSPVGGLGAGNDWNTVWSAGDGTVWLGGSNVGGGVYAQWTSTKSTTSQAGNSPVRAFAGLGDGRVFVVSDASIDLHQDGSSGYLTELEPGADMEYATAAWATPTRVFLAGTNAGGFAKLLAAHDLLHSPIVDLRELSGGQAMTHDVVAPATNFLVVAAFENGFEATYYTNSGSGWTGAALPVGYLETPFRMYTDRTGKYAVVGQSFLVVWNGSSWDDVEPPEFFNFNMRVTGDGMDNLFVGESNFSSPSMPGKVHRYTGGTWTTLEELPFTALGLWSPGGSVVYAAGINGQIRRHDGSAWQTMNLPDAETVRALWGTDDSNIMAVAGTAVYRWDGSSWTALDTPGVGTLTDIDGCGADDVWIAGAAAGLWFDGQRWRTFRNFSTDSSMRRIAATCDGAVVASDASVFSVLGVEP